MPPQQQWTGPAAPYVYVSPIPVRKANLGDALRSEWTKIRSVRSTLWTLGVMLVLILGIGLLAAGVVSGTDTELDSDASPLGLGFFGVLLSTICVMTLGVLTISSEFGTGLIRTTLTACPDRARVLTAKAIVFFLLTFVLTLVATTLVAMFDSAMLADQWDGEFTGAAYFKATVGVSLFIATLGLVALAVGALLRHSAGAITVMLGVVLLPLVVAMFMFGESLEKVRKALFEYSIPNQLAVFYGTDASEAASGPTGWEPLWIVLVVAALALGGAYTSLVKRDA
ncbi:ABC transporter permease [Streptomyces albireticuli]|nr:ABC transporter permease [Streptomyces albireticuli]MCD9144289.1 ABC transporter permease [Streptomyces albireticuli]MCD9162068.1 ABC transporter permease [Streptomyces albireticuli]MCD9193926.1 ABC transporter permease [Streptomyces albireticuli]